MPVVSKLNAPLFSVVAVPCDGGAVGVEIYAFPFSVVVIDDGTSIKVVVRTPHGPQDPGILELRVGYARLIAGETVPEDELSSDVFPWVQPRPMSVEYPEEQPTIGEVLTVALWIPRSPGSVRILLSREEAMVVFRDALGADMKSFTLFLNEDGSTLESARNAAA